VVKLALIILAVMTAGVLIFGFRNKIAAVLHLGDLSGFSPFSLSFNFSTIGGNITGSGTTVTSGNGAETGSKYTNLPEGVRDEDVSVYYGKVRVSASPISENVSPQQYPSVIRLYVNPASGEKIDLTGWKIQGNRGAIFVPRGVEYFLPPAGGTESDIIARGAVNLNIYSSASAIGKNFRMNRCIGYVTRANDFKPSLYGSCYSVPQKEYIYLPGVCQDYINSVNGRCENPYKDRPDSNYLSDECKAVLNKLNYTACYDEHSKDVDFLLSDFNVWAGTNILDSRHDLIRLYDKEGKFVDEYSY